MARGLSREDLTEFRGTLEKREQQLRRELDAGRRRAAAETYSQIASEAPDAGDASVADVVVDGMSAQRRTTVNTPDPKDAPEDAEDDYGTPAYSALDGAGFGLNREILASAADKQPSESHQPQRRGHTGAVDWPEKRWMGVQNTTEQTGRGVPPGQGDAEAGMPESKRE